MLPVFENIFDVIAFIVHHLPVGFQSTEERLHALEVVNKANPLHEERVARETARIEAEREKDTGRVTVPANQVSQPTITQADVDAAAAKAAEAAIAAYIASQENAKPATDTTGFTNVTPGFVPEQNPGL